MIEAGPPVAAGGTDRFVKVARGPGAVRLRREAAVLERAAHRGVVQLLSSTDDGDEVRLALRAEGPSTVADLARMDVAEVAGIGASLAATLAELHRGGISHNRISAEHVLVSRDGRLVLCGLADAGLRDPLPGEPPSFRPAADVAALVALIESMLADPSPGRGRRTPRRRLAGVLDRHEQSMDRLAADLARLAGPPMGESRGGSGSWLVTAGSPHPRIAAPQRTSPSSTISSPDTTDADTLMSQAHDPIDDVLAPAGSGSPLVTAGSVDPSDPRIEALALHHDDPLFAPTRDFGPRPPRPLAVADTGATRRLPPARWLVGLALIALLSGALTVVGLSPSGNRATAQAAANDGAAAAATEAAAATPADTAPADTAPADAAAAAPRAAERQAPASPPNSASDSVATGAAGLGLAACPVSFDAAAAGGLPAACAASVAVSGNRLQLGALVWEVGERADAVSLAVGDFDCDGWAEVAGLDRASGQLELFDGWAGATGEARARVVAVVTGVDTVRAVPAGSCHELTVTSNGVTTRTFGPQDLR